MADLTPYQILTLLFEPPAQPQPADAIEALYVVNQERAARGEKPSIPHWWADHLPRARP